MSFLYSLILHIRIFLFSLPIAPYPSQTLCVHVAPSKIHPFVLFCSSIFILAINPINIPPYSSSPVPLPYFNPQGPLDLNSITESRLISKPKKHYPISPSLSFSSFSLSLLLSLSLSLSIYLSIYLSFSLFLSLFL